MKGVVADVTIADVTGLSGWAVVGVESGNAELGVSGYWIAKGPGV